MGLGKIGFGQIYYQSIKNWFFCRQSGFGEIGFGETGWYGLKCIQYANNMYIKR